MLYKLALKRVSQESAVEDLRMLRIVRLAVASLMNKQGQSAAREAETMLDAIATGTNAKAENQQRKALKILAAHMRH